MPELPTSSTIYEEYQTLVAESVTLDNQTLVEGQPLTKYQVDGQLVYCSDLISSDLDVYRCFSFEGMQLTHGLNPKNQQLEALPQPITIKQVPKGRKS